MVYVPRATVKALAAIRDENTKPSNSMFGLQSGEGIRSRIRDAAIHAGLGDGYTGHSPRVDMARDLARFGIQLPALMAAGRWKSQIMPAYYLRNGEAGRAMERLAGLLWPSTTSVSSVTVMIPVDTKSWIPRRRWAVIGTVDPETAKGQASQASTVRTLRIPMPSVS